MSKKILFVDDDPSVLSGIRRALFEMSDEWYMSFVESGKAALELMQEERFDVIVSDMRMPEMDGVQLLNEVSSLYPHMVRIVLSGQSDKEMILKSVGPTHQYLTKPCNMEQLQKILDESYSIRMLLDHEKLQEVVSKLKSLPSLPTLYQEVMLEMEAPDFRLTRVGEIISQDAGMTAKILQLVNSSFFGLATRVTDPVHAVRLLGAETLKALLISVQLFAKFETIQSRYLSIHAFAHHSLAVAALARNIAKAEEQAKGIVEDAFISGILHDIGKLILAQNLPQEFDAAMRAAQAENKRLVDAEREIIASTHAEIGAYLIGLWGLPFDIVKTIAFHHHPADAGDTAFSALTAVHAANGLLGSDGIDQTYLENLELNSRTEVWNRLAEEVKTKED